MRSGSDSELASSVDATVVGLLRERPEVAVAVAGRETVVGEIVSVVTADLRDGSGSTNVPIFSGLTDAELIGPAHGVDDGADGVAGPADRHQGQQAGAARAQQRRDGERHRPAEHDAEGAASRRGESGQATARTTPSPAPSKATIRNQRRSAAGKASSHTGTEVPAIITKIAAWSARISQARVRAVQRPRWYAVLIASSVARLAR